MGSTIGEFDPRHHVHADYATIASISDEFGQNDTGFQGQAGFILNDPFIPTHDPLTVEQEEKSHEVVEIFDSDQEAEEVVSYKNILQRNTQGYDPKNYDPRKDAGIQSRIRGSGDSLEWWDEQPQTWIPAVFHNNIRGALLARSSNNGLQQYLPPCLRKTGKKGPRDETSYRADQSNWGPKPSHIGNIRDDILRRSRDGSDYTGLYDDVIPKRWYEDTHIVIDAAAHPVRDLPDLPLTLSSKVEPWLLVALTRLDKRISRHDIWARMPNDSGNLTMINNRITRWVKAQGLEMWPQSNAAVMKNPRYVQDTRAQMSQGVSPRSSTAPLVSRRRRWRAPHNHKRESPGLEDFASPSATPESEQRVPRRSGRRNADDGIESDSSLPLAVGSPRDPSAGRALSYEQQSSQQEPWIDVPRKRRRYHHSDDQDPPTTHGESRLDAADSSSYQRSLSTSVNDIDATIALGEPVFPEIAPRPALYNYSSTTVPPDSSSFQYQSQVPLTQNDADGINRPMPCQPHDVVIQDGLWSSQTDREHPSNVPQIPLQGPRDVMRRGAALASQRTNAITPNLFPATVPENYHTARPGDQLRISTPTSGATGETNAELLNTPWIQDSHDAGASSADLTAPIGQSASIPPQWQYPEISTPVPPLDDPAILGYDVPQANDEFADNPSNPPLREHWAVPQRSPPGLGIEDSAASKGTTTHHHPLHNPEPSEFDFAGTSIPISNFPVHTPEMELAYTVPWTLEQAQSIDLALQASRDQYLEFLQVAGVSTQDLQIPQMDVQACYFENWKNLQLHFEVQCLLAGLDDVAMSLRHVVRWSEEDGWGRFWLSG